MASANSSSLLSSLHHQLDENLGEMFFAVMTVAILFGITNVQAFTYFQNSRRDPNYQKFMVGLLWIFDALQFFMVADYGYTTLVVNFTNFLVVGKVTWSICWPILLAETGDFIIRLFYIRRIWIMSDRNSFLLITAMVLNFVALAFALIFMAKLLHLQSFLEISNISWSMFTSLGSGVAADLWIAICVTLWMQMVLNFVALAFALVFMAKLLHLQSFLEISNISWSMFTSLGSGVAADLWIAICVCYFLFRDKTGFQRTDTMLRKLTVYIIGTGLLTSFVTVACFISYAAMPNNGAYVAIYSCISKFYFNALLATLNTRKRLRGEVKSEGSNFNPGVYHMFRVADIGGQSSSTNGSSFRTRSLTSENSNEGRMRNEVIAISIKTETKYRSDESETDLDKNTSSIPI
ncbi:hypothetical protein A7U60_g5337 [Sanghuangporus baumii]|uniref:DUF6534 domain-containing protein n=1 Tax=Sanghuangporus baumii TaxID=108892 RepID=A0A9Q5HWR8_SANBA|nr:hypothetical protein A7U60_g5337 [Sanghuangporus baumii]